MLIQRATFARMDRDQSLNGDELAFGGPIPSASFGILRPLKHHRSSAEMRRDQDRLHSAFHLAMFDGILALTFWCRWPG